MSTEHNYMAYVYSKIKQQDENLESKKSVCARRNAQTSW